MSTTTIIRCLGGTVAAFAGGAHRLVHALSDQPTIATSLSQPRVPTTVFVHGLDSSKQTWTSVQSKLVELGRPSLAVDLRGHGESELGDPSSFSAEALARDVVRVVEETHGVQRPWIVCGHSMGGRIAMRIAAIAAEADPPMLAACVVEDMDAIPRSAPEGACVPFGRHFATWDEAREALVARGYAPSRVDSWRDARVRQLSDGSWWSDINPEAQWLARDRVLASSDGDEAWATLSRRQDALTFAVSLWVASDADTVCAWDGPGGIHDLKRRLPIATVTKFDDAAHSIHNSARPAFLRHLLAVIDAASAGCLRDRPR